MNSTFIVVMWKFLAVLALGAVGFVAILLLWFATPRRRKRDSDQDRAYFRRKYGE